MPKTLTYIYTRDSAHVACLTRDKNPAKYWVPVPYRIVLSSNPRFCVTRVREKKFFLQLYLLTKLFSTSKNFYFRFINFETLCNSFSFLTIFYSFLLSSSSSMKFIYVSTFCVRSTNGDVPEIRFNERPDRMRKRIIKEITRSDYVGCHRN